jgi:pyrroline-5-carboxylate reductase
MKLAMIGAGRMGGTIVQMLKKDSGSGWGLEVCEPNQKGRDELAKEVGSGVKFVDRMEELGDAEVILLAVKPAMLKDVAGWLQSRKSSYLLISILAGVTTETLAKGVGGKARVVRAMPNQALRVGEGVTALCAGAGAKREDLEVTRQIFALGGTVLEIGEEQMDVVTALSGSGPAFMAKWVEELEKAAVRAGLDSKVSGELAARTMLGTGALLVREGIKPSELCAAVASPGGTTEAGLKVMQAGGIEALAEKAMSAAVNRAKELAKGG